MGEGEAWDGAKVEWTNQALAVHRDEPNSSFILQDLWVGTYSDEQSGCWIEVGDTQGWDNDKTVRTYFWARNSPRGYNEAKVEGVARPANGAYQSYQITFERPDGWRLYQVFVGGRLVVNILNSGTSLKADTGIESTSPRNTAERTNFRNFRVRPWERTEWREWPNRTQSAEEPGRWEWTGGDAAWNEMFRRRVPPPIP